MTAQVIDFFDFEPRIKPLPTEPAIVVILPVIAKPHECCVIGCDCLGVVAIDFYSEKGAGRNGFSGTKFFCGRHNPISENRC